jgi:hypothetical protein
MHFGFISQNYLGFPLTIMQDDNYRYTYVLKIKNYGIHANTCKKFRTVT